MTHGKLFSGRYNSSIIRNFAVDNTSIMRQLFILILSALFLTGCNKTSTLLSLEDRASAGIWFCELREEVLTLIRRIPRSSVSMSPW